MDRLAELQTLHRELARRLGDMERVVRVHTPDLRAVADARLQLTRASRRRSEHIECVVFPYLLASEPQASLRGIEELRKDMAVRRIASTDHIARWRPGEIERDWAGYQAASEIIRSSMRHQMRREQEIIYPLLRRAAA